MTLKDQNTDKTSDDNLKKFEARLEKRFKEERRFYAEKYNELVVRLSEFYDEFKKSEQDLKAHTEKNEGLKSRKFGLFSFIIGLIGAIFGYGVFFALADEINQNGVSEITTTILHETTTTIPPVDQIRYRITINFASKIWHIENEEKEQVMIIPDILQGIETFNTKASDFFSFKELQNILFARLKNIPLTSEDVKALTDIRLEDKPLFPEDKLKPLIKNRIYFNVTDVESWDVLYIREQADHKTHRIGAIPYDGRCVIYLGQNKLSANKSLWKKIRYTSVGWVNGGFLMPAKNCANSESDHIYSDVTNVSGGDILYLHEEADHKSRKLGAIPYDGRCIPCLGENKYSKDGGLWKKVRYISEGWVNSRFLTSADDCR